MIAPRPLPPRRLPRVLPTPPRPAPAPRTGLHRIVYDETLFMLLQGGMDEMSAVAKALRLARTVTARHEGEPR